MFAAQSNCLKITRLNFLQKQKLINLGSRKGQKFEKIETRMSYKYCL